MNYLLIIRLSLASTVLVSFSIRYFAVFRHRPGLAESRLGFVILTSLLLYGGLLLASIDKMSYLSVFVTAAVGLAVCCLLEVGLQKFAKSVSKPAAQGSAIRYYG
jgi:hypothetical protein